MGNETFSKVLWGKMEIGKWEIKKWEMKSKFEQGSLLRLSYMSVYLPKFTHALERWVYGFVRYPLAYALLQISTFDSAARHIRQKKRTTAYAGCTIRVRRMYTSHTPDIHFGVRRCTLRLVEYHLEKFKNKLQKKNEVVCRLNVVDFPRSH